MDSGPVLTQRVCGRRDRQPGVSGLAQQRCSRRRTATWTRISQRERAREMHLPMFRLLPCANYVRDSGSGLDHYDKQAAMMSEVERRLKGGGCKGAAMIEGRSRACAQLPGSVRRKCRGRPIRKRGPGRREDGSSSGGLCLGVRGRRRRCRKDGWLTVWGRSLPVCASPAPGCCSGQAGGGEAAWASARHRGAGGSGEGSPAAGE